MRSLERLVLVALALAAFALAVEAMAAPPATASADDAVRLTADAVSGLARAWLVERLPADADRSAIEQVGSTRELVVPRGPTSTSVTLQAGSPSGGVVTLLVELTGTDASGVPAIRSATVTLRINAHVDVVVAVRELERRTVLGRGDVRIERRYGDRLPQGAFRDPGDVIGKEVVRSIGPGEPLTSSMLAIPRAVRRGGVVNLVLDGPGFRINARGVASEDGAVGEIIRVVNQASRRELIGRVEDDHTVRVSY
jgi:flagellar basal body P-ring formation protein FlgA